MSSSITDLKQRLEVSLKSMVAAPLDQAGRDLFATLGYKSPKQLNLNPDPIKFIAQLDPEKKMNQDRACVAQWKRALFLFQLTNDEIPSLGNIQVALFPDKQFQLGMIESFVFLAIELEGEVWTRTQLASITRELNRLFPMPAIVLFRYGNLASLAVIHRRPNKKVVEKDVLEKISLIKDIRLSQPHRAHIEILWDLSFSELSAKHSVHSFNELYKGWQESLSASALNKRFYNDLAHWYFWALKQTRFPSGQALDNEGLPSMAIIRLLTRLIFVWFIKEKSLVPETLFNVSDLGRILREDPLQNPDESTYYKAILQNLFFGTLNTEAGSRRWRNENKSSGMDGHYLIHTVYRYRDAFKNPDDALRLFSEIPFLNGGLFECLDRELSDRALQRHPALRSMATKEGNGLVLRVDGFSDKPGNGIHVPNKLFFALEEPLDLNEEYGTKGKRYTAKGLIEIFSRYKFTIEENTPVEEEVALDPELLGKVFENLLASYNTDTRITARKKSGAFYTPRAVVDYMVDEALIAHFERHLSSNELLSKKEPETESDDVDSRLRQLLSFTDSDHTFSNPEIDCLLQGIENLRTLDPACGSGAFPMGMLQKLVHVLKKLDPDNARWKAKNRAPLEAQLDSARQIPDLALKEDKITEAEAALERLERDFSGTHYADYSRKLYLIEKCLFGVDIQPIAVQIAKLRFFIALVVSQKVDRSKDNANITALPNLETKLVAADSLIPIDRPDQKGFHDPAIDEKEQELEDANSRYFAARTLKTKRKWRERIADLRDNLATLLEEDHFMSSDAAHQLVQWDPFDQNTSAGFFNPEWMFGLEGGFDVVIGNPPYVRQEEIKAMKEGFKRHYTCYTGTADLYVYFYERGIRLLKPHGVFAFITSNKWYRAKYGEKLREWLNRQTRIRRLIDFGDAEVFEAIAYPTIFIATRRASPVGQPQAGEHLIALNWKPGLDLDTFPQIFADQSFPVPQGELGREGWQLEPPLQRRLLERIRTVGTPLGDWCQGRFYRGILTGLNEAFVIPGWKKDELVAEDSRSAEIIKPFLRGRDVKRWRVEPQDLWLIKIESSENKQHPWSGLGQVEAERVFANSYPAIHQFFTSNDLRHKLIERYDQGHYPWELRSCAYWQEFDLPKIVVPSITDSVNYAPDQNGFLSNDKTTILVSEEWRFLLAILNSTISWWITKQSFASKQGGFFEFKPMYVSRIPIPPANEAQMSMLDVLVNIVRLGNESPRFEQLINALVYELFFAEDLHSFNLYLFQAVESAGLGRLAGLKGVALDQAARGLADEMFNPSHPIYAMLFDLQALEVVRLIEGKP